MIIPKHDHKLIAIDLNGHKELVADPRAIQQIEFIGQLKNEDGKKADEAQDVLILTILDQRNKITIFSRRLNNLRDRDGI